MSLNTLLPMQRATIPQIRIDDMTDVQLRFMSAFTSLEMTPVKNLKEHETLLKGLKGYLPLSARSRTLLSETLQKRTQGLIPNVGDMEPTLWKTGGAVYYSPTEIYLRKGTGEIDVLSNKIIPTLTPSTRMGVQAATVLTGTLMKITKGKIIENFQGKQFVERWGRNCPFRPAGYFEVVDAFREVADTTPVMAQIAAKPDTLTNDRALRGIMSILTQMNEELYYYYHTKIVFDFLCPYEDNPKYPEEETLKYTNRRHKLGNKLRCPESCYKLLPEDNFSPDFIKEVQRRGYPCVALYLGGMESCVRELKNVTDISAPLEARASSMAVRGSDSSCTSFLSKNFGYSGVTTELTKTFTRAVAMVGGVLEKLGPDVLVDVEIFSPGDVPLIYSSLMHHYEEDKRWRLVMTRHHYVNAEKKYRDRIITEPRRGAHFVSYKPVMMQSYAKSKQQGEKENAEVTKRNYQSDSHKWRPTESYTGYTIFTKLYGYYPWIGPKDSKDVSEGRGLSVSERLHPPCPHYVYGFGFSDDFQGICSTIQDYKLFGLKATIAVELKSRRVELQKTMVSLKLYKTELEFYRVVCAHNALRESYFCYARPLYSPISNVLHVEKGGVEIVYSSEFDEWSVVAQDSGIESVVSVQLQDFDKTGATFPKLYYTAEEREEELRKEHEKAAEKLKASERKITEKARRSVEGKISSTLGNTSSTRTSDMAETQESTAIKTYPPRKMQIIMASDDEEEEIPEDDEEDEETAGARAAELKRLLDA